MTKLQHSPTLSTSRICMFIGLAIFQVSAALATPPYHHSIHKRNIFQLCNLITRYTNRACFDYNNYGCFCGLGSAENSRPVDAVDRCCRVHDQCYGQISCIWLYPQFVTYAIPCSGDNNCQCTDSPSLSPCSYTTCQCDLAFAQCLGRAGFNSSLSNYDKATCQRISSS